MSKSISTFWWRWLVVANVMLMGLGLGLLLVPNLVHSVFYWLVYGTPTPPPDFGPGAARYVVFFGGILGGVSLGWAISLFYVIFIPFRRGERWAWYCMAFSVVGWFVTDSTFSVLSGYAVNLLLNSSFLVMFGLPLLATYRAFQRPTPGVAS